MLRGGAIALVILTCVACGDDDAPVADARVVPVDAAANAPDAALGAPDAAVPAVDASVADAPWPDAVPPDAARPDADPTPDGAVVGVVCGASICNIATQKCCVGTVSSCVGLADSCAGTSVSCDGPEDCKVGDVCCVEQSLTECIDTCSGDIICHMPSDCPGNMPNCCPSGGGGPNTCSAAACP